MKKIIVDCSKPLGEQETVVDISEEEKAFHLERSAQVELENSLPKPKTQEERIAELETKIAELIK